MACQTPYRGDTSQMLLFKIASCLAEGGAVAGVASFNGRTGIVTLTSGDVTGALGFTPISQANGDARYVLKAGDTMTGSLNIANSAPLVASDPALDITQTWNNAAATFTGLQSNITSTAAGANSLLFDFQLGGSSVLALQATGRLLLNGRAAFINTGSVGHILNTTDALNTAVVNVLTVGHSLSAGAAAAGFGSRIDMVADSATVTSQTQLRVDSSWSDATQATRTAVANFILPVSGTLVSHLTLTNNQAQFRDGTAPLPSLTFQSDPDTGIYRIGANSLGISAGGVLRLTVDGTSTTSAGTFLIPDGTVALPGLAFSADTDTGIYRIGANSFGLSAGGALSMAVSTAGVNVTAGLAYQYNAVNVIRAQTALNNYFFGPSGNLTMTGASNTSIGLDALASNTTGGNNTAIGQQSLFSNTTGSFNVGVGLQTLFSNLTGSRITAIGYSALFSNTGSNNIAFGYQALFSNTTGITNFAAGYQALFSNTTGSNNVAVGFSALFDLTTPATGQNTAVGYNTGRGITTGNNNTIIGSNVTGLAAALSNNIILADGAGVIRLQIDSSGNTTLAGTVATAAGTAALPAFSFTADPNTGLYNIGADSIGTSTGGTLRITTNTTDVILATAFRLAMASGANQRAGNAVLVGGTVTVANTSVTANTVVMLTRKTSGGTLGTAITYTVTAATDFTITSDSALDTSTFSYLLIEVP